MIFASVLSAAVGLSVLSAAVGLILVPFNYFTGSKIGLDEFRDYVPTSY
jgi:hypothetical protein